MCPCGSGLPLLECCGPLIEGELAAETPESLMRSRYTAFCLNKMDYIFTTTDPQTRAQFDWNANRKWASESEFSKLEVINTSIEGNKGTVEFKAYFKTADGVPHVHHELSKFRKQSNVWYFREGKVFAEENKS